MALPRLLLPSPSCTPRRGTTQPTTAHPPVRLTSTVSFYLQLTRLWKNYAQRQHWKLEGRAVCGLRSQSTGVRSHAPATNPGRKSVLPALWRASKQLVPNGQLQRSPSFVCRGLPLHAPFAVMAWSYGTWAPPLARPTMTSMVSMQPLWHSLSRVPQVPRVRPMSISNAPSITQKSAQIVKPQMLSNGVQQQPVILSPCLRVTDSDSPCHGLQFTHHLHNFCT